MSPDGSIEEHIEKVNDTIAKLKENGVERPEVKCPHHFGYLSKLGPEKSVPEECLLCKKVVECIVSEQG
jgi:hypothetical protein